MLALRRIKTAPWGKVLAFLAVLAALIMLASGVPGAYRAYHEAATAGGDPQSAALNAFLMSVVGALFLSAVLLFYFTLMWVMFDIPGSWRATRQFFKDLPENFRKFRRVVGVCFRFVIGLPGRFVRGLVAACRWLGTVPSLLRSVDWGFVAFAACILSIGAGVGWLLWPAASSFVSWLPTWMHLHSEFLTVLYVDAIMAMFPTVFIVTIVASIVRAIFRGKRRRH